MLHHRVVTAATVAALTITSLAGCSAIDAAAAARAHPTTTVTVTAAPRPAVTVTAEPVSTGVDQATYDACTAAYRQVVTLLAKQTDILQGVSFAASDGFNAIANGDAAGLSDASDKITTYGGQEQALSGQVEAVDHSACQ